MAKTRKRPAKKTAKTGQVKKPATKPAEFSLKQTSSPFLQHYLALVRDYELVALGVLFLLILIAVAAFAAPDYLEYRASPQALKDKINSLEGDRRTEFLEKAQSKKPKELRYSIINCELARHYYRQGEEDKALEIFKDLERHFKDYGQPREYRDIFANLAKIYMKRGDYAQADPYLARAIALGAYDNEFKLLLGESLLKAQRPIEAAAWLELVIENETYGEEAQQLMRQVERELIKAP